LFRVLSIFSVENSDRWICSFDFTRLWTWYNLWCLSKERRFKNTKHCKI